ncbi:MAG TPA: hypothetical protein VGW10_06400 [Solirubrobacteraceae bacterium]|nr:hypothetical protein [Solirubrobacteraceae bacterium]
MEQHEQRPLAVRSVRHQHAVLERPADRAAALLERLGAAAGAAAAARQRRQQQR